MDVATEKLITEMPMLTFSWYDYTFFFLMLGFSTLIGIYFGFFGSKQSTAEEYLLGGREMSVIPIAISLTASFISGIMLLAVPTDVYRFGATYWIYAITLIPIYFAITRIYFPVFFGLNITSVYEYLELRFNKTIRLLSSFLFTILNLLYLPIVIYIPALALEQTTGINLYYTTPIVCGVCIFYTTIGGLKAVVWTDTLQFFVMMGSMIGVFIMGITSVGGFGNMWRINTAGQRTQIDFDFDPTKRDTFWADFIGLLISGLSILCIAQGFVQKYLALPTAKDVSRAVQIFTVLLAVIVSFSVLTGLIMYARYHDCDPFSAGLIKHHDDVLPYYVMDVAGSIPGLTGLFLSGIFSAALSTLSATMNSLSASLYEDFCKPFVPKDISKKAVSNLLKFIVVIIGIISTGLVFVIDKMGNSILPINFAFAGITAGPLLGLFTLGMVVPAANSKGALSGGLCSLAVMTFIIAGAQISKSARFDPKPFSVEGCIVPVVTNILNSTISAAPSEAEGFILFRITHYYYTVIGSLLVFVVGVPVSYITRKEEDPVVKRELLAPCIADWCLGKEEKKGSYLNIETALNVITSTEKEVER